MKVTNKLIAACLAKAIQDPTFFSILLISSTRKLKQTTTSVLHFKGKLTFECIGILLNDLKNRKETYNIQPVLYKKLLTLMIEVLENVLKYSDNFEDFIDQENDYFPEFELKRYETGFIYAPKLRA